MADNSETEIQGCPLAVGGATGDTARHAAFEADKFVATWVATVATTGDARQPATNAGYHRKRPGSEVATPCGDTADPVRRVARHGTTWARGNA